MFTAPGVRLCLVLLPGLGALLLGAAPEALAEARAALVIGNASYVGMPPLDNPANDARDMAVVLEELGFETELLIDANRKQMRDGIRGFARRVRRDKGVGLFYFAGHGVQIRGENYLIPIGTQIEDAADVDAEAVRADEILQRLEGAENQLTVAIYDACRNNPFPSVTRSATRGLAIMRAPIGTLVAYSTAPGSVALDGTGRNGVYTRELIRALDEPGLRLEDVFVRTRVGVQRATDGKQVPWESSSLTGVFRFHEMTGDEAPPLAVPSCPNGSSWNGARCVAPAIPDRNPARSSKPALPGSCRNNDGPACFADAEKLAARGAQADRVIDLYERSCLAGHAPGCSEFGAAMAAQERWDDARDPLRRACEADELRACYSLGRIVLNVDGDSERAMRLFANACRAGQGYDRACRYLGGRR